ncbi:hypothetical protein EIMP300_35770 [Escherichia coli]|uniref:Lipid A biosynthesis lauroyl acyltransferase n=1 Tax=Escherichia coli TaxID=562 RepID=A0A8S0FNZ0_ECOLX|nr:hypothetical protein EIMP300_35770 [Escherichia coli]
MFPKCKFSREFLHPRYWLTWFGLGVLWLWACRYVQLPYPVLCFLGTRIGTMARPFLKRRESIARKNLELCFPQHSAEEREKMIAENFRSLGMALVETGMAWFWPDSRVRKWFDVEGLDNLKRAQMQNRGVMVVGVHFMSLELGGRVMGLCQPMMATYRPHNNQLMEWVQTRGRMRSNKAMIGRNNLRGIVSALTCRKVKRYGLLPIRIMVVKAAPSRRSLRWKMSPQPMAPMSSLVSLAQPC